jgi:hypothetical protein
VKIFMNARALWATLIATALCSCADLRLYNAGQDQIAKKAAAAVNEAEIGKSLAPEREAIAAMAKSEQDAVRRDQIGRRDRRLIAWLSASDQQHSWDSLDDYVSKRIQALTGTSNTDLIKRIDSNAAVLKTSRDTFEREAKSLLNVTGGVELKCPIQESQQYPNDPEKKVLLGPAFNACKNLLEAQQNLAAAVAAGGLMKTLDDELKEIGKDQQKIEDNLKQAKQRYDTALKTLKAKPAGDASATAGVKTALEDLEKLPSEASLKKISADPVLKRLVDEGKITQLEKKRELVRDLLMALDTGKPPESASDDQKNAAAIGALWHAIGDRPPPPMTGLLMESEFLRQESNGLQMQVNRAKQRIQLKQAKLASMQDEVSFLLHAEKAKWAYVDMGSRCPSVKGRSMYDAWEKASMSCRNLIVQRLISVLNAMTFGEAQQELIDYQLIAQGHDAALDSSEVAINQADSLIRLPMAQLSKAYGDGITPQQLGNLINALGLGAIAVRVK